MEERKLDTNSIIGFILIFGILLFMMYRNQPTPEEIEAQKAEQAKIEAEKQAAEQQDTKVVTTEDFTAVNPNDSLKVEALKNKLGAFAYASTLPSASDNETVVETDKLALKFSNKGGYLSEVRLKEFVDYKKQPIYLIKDGNADLNLSFQADNRNLNTKDLYFQPTVTKDGENTVVSMKLKVSENKFLEYRYELKPDDYMLDFVVRSQGLSDVFNTKEPIELDWNLKGYRHAKSIQYENRYTDLHYEFEDGDDDYLGQMEDEEHVKDVTWLGYKQHFFSSILLTDKAFPTAHIKSKNLVEDETIDTVYTKQFNSKIPLSLAGGELNESLNWYYGPSDLKVLEAYDRNLDEIVPLGWGIFGVINKYVITPLYGFLSSIMPYGIAIIVMTILIKLALSVVQYKQYVSQAKMKVLKPEITAISEKYKDNPMKRQQETMALYSKAGASPMAGCLPALLQLPVFYALFMFFPSAFALRQKSFLWADDLASYDTIIKLPFNIPFYGDHVSLFPILAAVAIFFYMRMTTGQQAAMSQPAQEGMPDMQQMMKYMIYFSPLMMLIFFNNYASGLSLYYFVSNLLTIGIMLVIKNYIIDEDKIHAQIQENKKKPKKQSKFQQRMKDMMEQAEKQRQMQQKQKKK